MQLGGSRSRCRIAARQHDAQRCAAAAHCLDHPSVALPDALLREGQLAVAVAGGHIHAGEIEHHVGIRGVEHHRQMPLQRVEILGVAHAVFQGQVQSGTHLRQGIIPLPVHRERKHLIVGFEDGRGAVALVDVEIDDGRPLDQAFRPQLADGDGHIVEHTESLGMIGERMMGTAGQIPGQSLVERRAPRQQSPGRGKTRSLPKCL